MKYRKLTVLTLILAITLVGIVPALAAAPAQEPTTCTPNPDTGLVSGTVVAVDPVTGLVTVDLGGGALCTVNISVDETHPIVLLLGEYYGDLSPATLEDALTDVQGCAVDIGDGTWAWAECGSEGAIPVRVTGTNEDGTFIAVDENGVPIGPLVIEDDVVAGEVQGALETLIVAWTLEDDGSLTQVSDQIAAYHEEGMGFGVLVKLYAIAQESEECLLNPECTVDSLVQLFQSGEVGMGQIFKEYGKPQKLGVGHVRQELTDNEKGNDKVKDKDKGDDDQSGDESQTLPPAANKKNDKPQKDNNGLKGICNAISKNGKPKAGVTCP